MTERRLPLRRILGPTGPDAGCDRSAALLDQLVEAELASADPRDVRPDVALHLEACPDCREDHDGLLALIRAADGDTRSTRS